MSKRMPRPEVRVGDVVENRQGKRRRFWGNTISRLYGTPMRGRVVWEAVSPRIRRPGWMSCPLVDDAPEDSRDYLNTMSPEGWNRWIAGGRVVEEPGQ